jgi:hypothetical protein
VRKLGRVKCLYENFSCPELGEGKNFFGCMRCRQKREYFFNGVCDNCFYEIQRKEGCVCPFTKLKQGSLYYCSLCEEFHGPDSSVICRQCAEGQDSKNENFRRKETSFSSGSLGILVVIVVIVVGLFLVLKKRKKSSQ